MHGQGGKADAVFPLERLDLPDHVVQILRLGGGPLQTVDDHMHVGECFAHFLHRRDGLRVVGVNADKQVIHGFRIVRGVQKIRDHIADHVGLVPCRDGHGEHLWRRVPQPVKIEDVVRVLVFFPAQQAGDHRKDDPQRIVDPADKVNEDQYKAKNPDQRDPVHPLSPIPVVRSRRFDALSFGLPLPWKKRRRSRLYILRGAPARVKADKILQESAKKPVNAAPFMPRATRPPTGSAPA